MDLITVNKQTCTKDGLCAAVCPINLIDFKQGEYPAPIAEAEELCITCGHCVAVCSTESLLHRDIPLTDCSDIKKEFLASAEQCEQFLRQRRSIRVYQDKPVPRERLIKLIDIARYAPSGHNSQSAEWLVINNREELHKLAGIVADWMRWMLTNMKEFALSMHMDRTLARWEQGHDVILRGAPAVIIAHAAKSDRLAPSTCTIALTYLELAATSMGLGGCWAGYFNAAATTFPPMMAALALPEGHQCFGAMMAGFSKYQYKRLPPRKPPVITWR
ncbi:MAG: nitroreductase family protein [Desulfuromonadaceae bacterium]|nr:nitroreductase family protein [Desulfuromonadaceae bacterium]MDD5106847.1 nitroreductase family protein [Desulfuromonadaceae bacterium]